MSLDVATCACGQRYYRFRHLEWDCRYELLWCRECRADRVGASTGLPKLDRVEARG